MHKFLRSIGFSTYRKKRDIEKLLASLIPSAKWHRIQLDEETNLCELRAEVAPGTVSYTHLTLPTKLEV